MKIVSHKESVTGTGEITKEYADKTFEELLAFQGYGFCLGYDTIVEKNSGNFVPISELKIGDFIKAPKKEDSEFVKVTNILPNGEKDVFEIELENGKKIKSTLEHLFLCSDGMKHTMYEIIEKKLEIMCENKN